MQRICICRYSSLPRHLMHAFQVANYHLLIYCTDENVYAFGRYSLGVSCPLDISGVVVDDHLYNVENDCYYSLDTGVAISFDTFVFPLTIYKASVIADMIFIDLPDDS